MKKRISFDEFEKAVMQKMLQKNNEINEVLQKQYQKSRIVKRSCTGAGFFTEFQISQDAPHLLQTIEGGYGDIVASINGSSFDYGFVLFIKNGVLTCLEGYTWADTWPEMIYEYTLTYSDLIIKG